MLLNRMVYSKSSEQDKVVATCKSYHFHEVTKHCSAICLCIIIYLLNYIFTMCIARID